MLSCSIRSVLAVWKLLRSDTLTISGIHTWNLRWNYWNFFFSTQKKLQSKYLWGQIINFERKYLTLLYTDVSTWVNQIVNNVLAPTHSAKVRRGHIIYLLQHNITKILLGMPLEVIVVWFPKQVTIHKFF